MANKDIPDGSVVRLSEDTSWEIGFDNPIGVNGIVDGVTKYLGYIHVNWLNGSKNAYRPCDSDLIVVEGKV